MMYQIKEKREALERFIREQTIGPGACGNRYFLLKEWEASVLAKRSLSVCQPLENTSEVIDEVPAYYYGTGILFPPSMIVENSAQEAGGQVVSSAEENNEEQTSGHTSEEDQEVEKASIDQENKTAGNQNYPTSCGLSFAIGEKTDITTDLSIELSFRTYTVIKPKNLTSNFGIWIDENLEEIALLVERYFSEFFYTETKDDNLFILTKVVGFSKENSYRLDYMAFETFQHNYLEEWMDQKERYQGEMMIKGERYEIRPIRIDEWIKALEERFLKSNLNESEIRLVHRLTTINKIKEIIETFKAVLLDRKPVWSSRAHMYPIQLPAYIGGKRQIGHLPVYKKEDLEIILHYQYVRKNDTLYVKLILENTSEAIKLNANGPFQLNKKDEANLKSFFNPTLTVKETKKGVICRYNPPNVRNFDRDEDFNKILYRQYADLGEGYNISVVWKEGEHGMRLIRTEYIPSSDTPNIDTRPGKIWDGRIEPRLSDPAVLRIKRLSTLDSRSDKDIQSDLNLFISDYSVWIEEKKGVLNELDLEDEAKSMLQVQLGTCEGDLKRLKRNVRLLKDSDAMAAFRTMNTAMFIQLHHSIFIKDAEKRCVLPYIVDPSEETYKEISDDTPDKKGNISWKAFQLAFILLNIDGFIKPPSDDQLFNQEAKELNSSWYERNDLADLVWFPTGGGKTEAYLGIIAFAIAYRRFTKGSKGYGTTVIMRYTLRLLTLQQFQRATLLICALELIRSRGFALKGKSLGKERITIGLFVGGSSLPNKWDESDASNKRIGMKQEIKKLVNALENGNDPETRLPHTECPWCGGELWDKYDPESFLFKKDNRGEPKSPLRMWCRQNGCAYNDPGLFDNELPLILYDEAIYRTPPTLLFGTVDKFAQLAHKVSDTPQEDSRRIFKGKDGDVLPPELIIQDELHLLLGPLGSAVGVFERAVDKLCTYQSNGIEIRPKVITSTATTRNTDKQIFGLFDRRISIFPKQGIDCDDSFFAYYDREMKDGEMVYKSNRRYIGILPIGKTQVWMQLRIVAACLVHRSISLSKATQLESLLSDKNGIRAEVIQMVDYYHTVLGYFNSLKEVGKTESQLHHYLPNEVKLLRQKATSWNILHDILNPGEEIHYSELTGRLNGEQVKSNLSVIRTPWRITNPPASPPDYVISTNMISVGVDISRLNTMVITSMPRNIAEYIQASSRVARDKEGLVATVHHPFRSRDLSHYQHFVEFHEKFYSYVEPISITPFASKALERYLALFLAALVRHDKRELAIEASNINEALKDQLLIEMSNMMSVLKERADKMGMMDVLDVDEFNGTLEKFRELLEDRWLERRVSQEGLKYRDTNSSTSLYQTKSGKADHGNWNVKESLRAVDPESVIKTVQM